VTQIAVRLVAIAIAVAGLIDPALTMSAHTRARIALVVQGGPTMARPWRDGTTRHATATRVRDRLVHDLGGDFDIQPRLTSDAAAAIVIGDHYPESSPTTNVSTVTVSGDVLPNVRIVRVDAPRDVPAGTAMHVGVDVEGSGVAGKSSSLVLRAGGLDVARASHVWRGDRDRWHTELDAVPVGEPPFVLRAEVQTAGGDRTAIDNVADTLVDLRRTPFRVEVYEPRPSWATTFVRRALEADARFHVSSLTITAEKRGEVSASVRAGGGAPAREEKAAALDRFDVVVAGGLDRLTGADARALERFMRLRGGVVVLVPDAKIANAAARDLVRDVTMTERLSERPETLTVVAPLAPIRASELLLVRGSPLMTDRIAWTSGADPSPVIVSMPRGDGRLVVSGALDAWRFRAEDERAFDRFWQSTVAGLALAVPLPIDVTVVPPILNPGEHGDIIVRTRATPVRASIDGRPIRLWPEAESGVFRGSFTARDTDGRSTVVAQVDGATSSSTSRSVIVSAGARHPLPDTTAPLSLLSASRQGTDVTPDQIGTLEQFVRRTVIPSPAIVTRRPMRSPWWMIPFAACLSVEWYLRRRRGDR